MLESQVCCSLALTRAARLQSVDAHDASGRGRKITGLLLRTHEPINSYASHVHVSYSLLFMYETIAVSP